MLEDNSNTQDIGPDLDEKPWFAPIENSLDRIANYSERQREKYAPEIVEFGEGDGKGGTLILRNPYATYQRLRIIGILMRTVTAGVWVLSFQGRSFRFSMAANTTTYVVFPYEVDRGVDIVVSRTTGAEGTWNLYLFAYSE